MKNLRYLWYNGSVARVAPEKQVPACLPLNNNRELLWEVIKMGKTKTHEQFISEVEELVGNDEIKKDFCEENNIPLLIINYNDNIEAKINTTTIMSQAYLETVGRCND